jgi:hypothetical protein
MLNKIIIAFLAGIILKHSYEVDLSFMSFIMSFMIIMSFTFIKDMKYTSDPKMSFIKRNIVYKSTSTVYVVLAMSFIAGALYIDYFEKPVSYLSYTKSNIKTEGLIVNRESKVDGQVLTIKVEEGSHVYINNIDTPTPADRDIYLRLPVSLFQEYDLYEKLQIEGNTSGLYGNIIPQKRPLFLRYETDTFLSERFVYLNKYNLKLEKIPYELTLSQEIMKLLAASCTLRRGIFMC